MAENNLLSLKIDDSVIKPIVEKQIQAAIVTAIGNKEDLIDSLVKTALHQKVNSNGNIGSYSSDNKFDFLDMVVKLFQQERHHLVTRHFLILALLGAPDDFFGGAEIWLEGKLLQFLCWLALAKMQQFAKSPELAP